MSQTSDKKVSGTVTRQKKWMMAVVAAAIAVGGCYLAFFRGEKVLAPKFSAGDTWTWAGTTLGADDENTFTRTDSVIGKQARLGRECWVFRSAGADNTDWYSLDYHYIEADGWYIAGNESFSDNVKTGEMIPSGPLLSIEFPLEVGKKWVDIRAASGYDNTRGIGYMELQMISRGEVLSKGDVTVPAGTFQAYKIEFTVLMSGAARVTVEGQELTAQISTTITGTRWYSPRVKNFVKETSDMTTMVTVLWETTTTKTHAEMELTNYSLGG